MIEATSPIPAAAQALATTLDEAGYPSVWLMAGDTPTVFTMAPMALVAHCANLITALYTLGTP